MFNRSLRLTFLALITLLPLTFFAPESFAEGPLPSPAVLKKLSQEAASSPPSFSGISLIFNPEIANPGIPGEVFDQENLAKIKAIRQKTAAKGAIEVHYFDSRVPAFNQVKNDFQRGAYLEDMLSELGDNYHFPTSLHIALVDCGRPNAFYFGGEAAIFLCYEMMAKVADNFRQMKLGLSQEFNSAVLGSLLFIVMHEVGHALAELMRLPVVGNSEDAADAIAATLMLKKGPPNDKHLLFAANSMKAEPAVFWDIHPVGPQRFYNLMCLIFGAVNDPNMRLNGDENFNQFRRPTCTREYQASLAATMSMLEPYRKPQAKKLELKAVSELLSPKVLPPTPPPPPPKGWEDSYEEALYYQMKFVAGMGSVLENGGSSQELSLWIQRYLNASAHGLSAIKTRLLGLTPKETFLYREKHKQLIQNIKSQFQNLEKTHPVIFHEDAKETVFKVVPIRW